MNIVSIQCTNCLANIKFDTEKLNAEKPLVRCPICQHINTVTSEQMKAKTAPTNEKTNIETPTEVGWLIVHDENTPEQTLPLKMGKNIIGRASDSKPNDVPIRTEDKYMSRNHCVIEIAQQPTGRLEYVLYDLNSANGTYLNGSKSTRLKPDMQLILKDGDTIQIGRTKVVLKTAQQAQNAHSARQTVIISNYTPTIIV